MTRIPLSLALLAVLAACSDSQPLIFAEDEIAEDEIVDDEPVDTDNLTIEETLDEGTDEFDLAAAREARGDISRGEELDLETGAGFAEDYVINIDDDTLTIDNVAFDGLNVYTRGADFDEPRISDIGTVAVYHGDTTVPDFLTSTPVPQLVPYVALYEESDVIIVEDEDSSLESAPRTSFAIVRTGAYADPFGVGGFVYERVGDVVLPDAGQATFSGDYAAIRIYEERNQTELVEGDIVINIDFGDFNDLPGVTGLIYDRQAFTVEGEEIPTTSEIDRLDADLTEFAAGTELEDVIQLPDLPFVIRISGESIASDGEISGEVKSSFVDPVSGQTGDYETGNYYAIIAGDTTDPTDGGEIVGVVVTTSSDSRYLDVTAQETGGFIAKR